MNQSSINMDAKKSAHHLLESVWGNRGFPVDPAWIAAELGMTVVETELPENVLASLVKDKDKDPVIVLNQLNSSVNRRYDCAHHIGHFVDRVTHDSDFYRYLDLRMQQGSAVLSEEDAFANYFGNSLLMPESEIKRLVKAGASLDSMAQHFGVTEDAMAFRLKALDVSVQLSELVYEH